MLVMLLTGGVRMRMTLEEFRELFEKMCTECGSDMRRILIKNKVVLD